MDTLLQNGDYAKDERGYPVTVSGAQELAQRVLIRLTTKKGGFAPDPALGSALHRIKGAAFAADAQRQVSEAVLMVGGLQLRGITCTEQPQNAVRIDIRLAGQGAQPALSVTV